MESSPDSKVVSEIRPLFNQSVSKAFQLFIIQSGVQRAVQKCLASFPVVNDVATRTIVAPAFTYIVAKFLKNEVVKGSYKTVETEQYKNASKIAFVNHETKAED